MDDAKQGAILVSFGTIALSHQMPDRLKHMFLEAFSEFPHIKFIFKYEKPEHQFSKNYSNVIESTWIPQRDLFAHKNLIGFITHGGLNSIMEAAYGGIPVLAIGLFGDQEKNAKMAEYRNYALAVDKMTLTKEVLVEKLRELIENKK